MKLPPFTPEWAAAFRAAIEDDHAYRETAARWTWPVALVLDAAPEYGFAEPVALELTLDRGRCHRAEIRARDAVQAPIVLSAPYAVWKAIVRGELDPLAGVATGQVAVHGAVMPLMLHPRAATALLSCARAVPTRYPDEADG